MTASNVIVVFARAPEPGKVKTRLAQVLGDESAKQLYVAMLRDTLNHAQAAARLVENCTVVVAFTPDNAFGAHPYSLAELWNGARHAQSGNDLGARMLHSFRELFAQGAQRVVIIGSDMPTLQPQTLAQAFDYLAANSLVFGPAHDGGFYLIGASAPFSKQLFTNVQWSSHSTLQQVLANAQNLNLKVRLLPKGRDVDTIEDLRDLALRLRTDELPIADSPHTFESLRRENLL